MSARNRRMFTWLSSTVRIAIARSTSMPSRRETDGWIDKNLVPVLLVPDGILDQPLPLCLLFQESCPGRYTGCVRLITEQAHIPKKPPALAVFFRQSLGHHPEKQGEYTNRRPAHPRNPGAHHSRGAHAGTCPHQPLQRDGHPLPQEPPRDSPWPGRSACRRQRSVLHPRCELRHGVRNATGEGA